MRNKTIALSTFFLLFFSILPVTPALAADKPVVRFGVSLRFHPITMYERYQPMMDFLTQNTPYRFELKIGSDYLETIRFVADGKADFAFLDDGGLKEMTAYGASPLVKPLNEAGKPFYRCCLVVPAASRIRSVEELKGKRVAFGYRQSISSNLIPRRLLTEHGVKLADLRAARNLRHQSDVAEEVLKGVYDAGFVKDSIAIRYRNKGLKVVASSGDIPSMPLVARGGAPKEMVAAVRTALLKLDCRTPEHRRIMQKWDVDYRNGFVTATAADYLTLKGYRDIAPTTSHGAVDD